MTIENRRIQEMQSNSNQFLERFVIWTSVAKNEGFPTKLFESMIGAFSLEPQIMSTLINQSVSLAQATLNQTREHSVPSIVFPIATALRMTAKQHPELWNKSDDALSVSSWTAKDVVNIALNQNHQLIELSGTQTMAKNVPQRAGFIFDLLGMTPQAAELRQKPLAFIELGASAGLITTALSHPQEFQKWLNQQDTVAPNNRQLTFLPEHTSAIGIDLNVPFDQWAIACTDDDSIRAGVIDFINRSGSLRSPVFKGNALEFSTHPEIIRFLAQSPEATPVIVMSMFVYQLPAEKRAVLAKQVRNFAIKHNALIVFADATSIIDQSSGWCAWIENGNGRITPILNLQEEPILSWGGNLQKFDYITSLAQIFPETPDALGEEFGQGLRNASHYQDTQKTLEEEGITEAVLNQTPPVGLNLRLLTEMPVMQDLKNSLSHQSVNAAILGIAIPEGIPDFQRFLKTALEKNWKQLEVIDIDSEILQQVANLVTQKNLPEVNIRETDARNTGIENSSQQIVLRDHLGNCCPPLIDRQIDKEVHRILTPNGISIVNITTSELLKQSPNRATINFSKLKSITSPEIITALQSDIFNLSQLERMFGKKFGKLRGILLEIEPEKSFVVFGEDETGHGEWFRPLNDHLDIFKKDGFQLLAIQSREGNDSHNPPLHCLRHNLILQKI